MQAFCEAAAMNFQECSKPLAQVFEGEKQEIAAALHTAFVSYHVGIRQDALNAMVELVNKHSDLPTLSLLLGNMLAAANQLPMAQKCWLLAVRRDQTRWSSSGSRECSICAAQATTHLRRAESKQLLRSSSRRGTRQRTRPGPLPDQLAATRVPSCRLPLQIAGSAPADLQSSSDDSVSGANRIFRLTHRKNRW